MTRCPNCLESASGVCTLHNGSAVVNRQPAEWHRHCYYCGVSVKKAEHDNVQRVLTELWMTAMMDEVEGVTPENSFVHMTGVKPDQLDTNGDVVVCAADCIREMAENIKEAE